MSEPRIYWLKKSCDHAHEYWETEVSISLKPDEDFAQADPFVEKADYDALKAENEKLKGFKEQWDAKDGNSPGYNYDKAKLYGEQACQLRIERDKLQSQVEILKAALTKYSYEEHHGFTAREALKACEHMRTSMSASKLGEGEK